MRILRRRNTLSTPLVVAKAANRQGGASTVESTVMVLLLLTTLLGMFQGLLAYRAKISLNHAVTEAVRTGAVRHGQSADMKKTLAEQLSPLYGGWGTNGSNGLIKAIADSTLDTTTPVQADGAGLQLHILNPTAEAFDAFGEPNQDNVVEIQNHHLKHLDRSVDSTAGVNIQDANLLKIHVTYGFKLNVPIIDKIIAKAGNAFDPDKSAYYSATPPRLPLTSTAVARMHTAPRMDDATLSLEDDLKTVTAVVVPPGEVEETETEPQPEPDGTSGDGSSDNPSDSNPDDDNKPDDDDENTDEEEEITPQESIDIAAENITDTTVDTNDVECTSTWDDSRYNAEVTWNPSTWLNGIETAKNVVSDFIDGLFDGITEQFQDLWNLLKDPSVILDMAQELIKNPRQFIEQIIEEVVTDVQRVLNCGPRDIGLVIGKNLDVAVAVKIVSRLADITNNNRLARYVDETNPNVRCRVRTSFEAGTLVLTATGLRPIEDLLAGELVGTRRYNNESVVYRPITATHHRIAQSIHRLVTSNGTLHVTGEHPFYLQDNGWTPANELSDEDVISSLFGNATVQDNQFINHASPVYNLTVDYGETYFVVPEGATVSDAIWAHNTSGRQSCWGPDDLFSPPSRIGNTNSYEIEVNVDTNNSVTRETVVVYVGKDADGNPRYYDLENQPPEGGRARRPDIYMDPPKGHYWVRNPNGSVYLRRYDTNVPRQVTNADGTGFVDFVGGNRILSSTRLARQLGDRPDWPPRADGSASSAAHHIIPSQVVRDNPLLARAHAEGPYDFDGADNGIYLPTTPEAQAAARASNWPNPSPLHNSGHGDYNAAVTNIANDELDRLLRRYNDVKRIPHSEMTAAIQRINDAARNLLTVDVLE